MIREKAKEMIARSLWILNGRQAIRNEWTRTESYWPFCLSNRTESNQGYLRRFGKNNWVIHIWCLAIKCKCRSSRSCFKFWHGDGIVISENQSISFNWMTLAEGQKFCDILTIQRHKNSVKVPQNFLPNRTCQKQPNPNKNFRRFLMMWTIGALPVWFELGS